MPGPGTAVHRRDNMDFTLTEEHHMIREACRKFAEKSLKPKASEYDRTHEFPWEHVKSSEKWE